METDIGQLLSITWAAAVVWFGGLWAVCLFFRKVFKDADDELDPTKRQELADRLTGIGSQDPGEWVPDFTDVFDWFFGKRHLRWRCFYRSSLVSIVSFVLIAALLGYNLQVDVTAENLVAQLAVVFLVNVFVDYASLLETRLLLRAEWRLWIRIVLDAALTVSISFIWLVSVTWMPGFLGLIETEPTFLENARTILGKLLNAHPGPSTVILTSLTTSVWLWLHGSAQLSIRALRTGSSLVGWLNVKEKPMRAIGTTINGIVLVIGTATFPIYLILR